MQESPVYVSLEFTPNPNTLKYSVNREFLPRGAMNFTCVEDAQKRSPLAFRLLSVEGIAGVMIGKDFVTVTKSEQGDWDHVHRHAAQVIEDILSRGEASIFPEALSEATGVSTGPLEGLGEMEKKICELLDREIRPAVAMDGGDIAFEKYESGVVYLFLQGSCKGCPSASMTLKMGIETRLKEVFPEIREVVSVS